ncbi:unnamed protein product, partial [Medioppia subpectinata]
MIVMPLFGDQYDNAQRVMEKGFGIRLNPHTVSEQELLNSIEKLLNDKELKHKLSVAVKRIQNSNCNSKAAEAVGNVNACIGLAEVLLSRGHKIVFAIDQSFAGKLSPFGFIEEVLSSDQTSEIPGEMLAKYLLDSGLISNVSSFESINISRDSGFMDVFFDTKRVNELSLKRIAAKHSPDLYVIDDFIPSPTIVKSNKPWVYVVCLNPLCGFIDEKLPPSCSGFPINGNRNEWKEFKKVLNNAFVKQNIKYNEWLEEEGLPTVDVNKITIQSPYLNIYGFPEELDYTDIRPIPEKWLRVDTFMRRGEKQEFKIPDKFRDRDIEK